MLGRVLNAVLCTTMLSDRCRKDLPMVQRGMLASTAFICFALSHRLQGILMNATSLPRTFRIMFVPVLLSEPFISRLHDLSPGWRQCPVDSSSTDSWQGMLPYF